MIQRIQSVFLFLAAILNGLVLFLPMWSVIAGGNEVHMSGIGIEETAYHDQDGWMGYALPALVVTATLVLFGAIFLYKNRANQVRIITAGMLILIFEIVVAALFSSELGEMVGNLGDAGSFEIAFIFPPVALALCLFARRGVIKDEKLVRSADRFY